jgi:ankyrin repeat protein
VPTRSLKEILDSTAEVLFPEILEGAVVDVDSRDCNGDTPLHVMCWRDDIEAVRALIAAGADPNAIGDMSETPLHVACRVANAEMIRALLAAGGKPDIRGEFDVTPSEIARGDPAIAGAFGSNYDT